MSDVETIETPAYEIARKFCHGDEAAAAAIRELLRAEREACAALVEIMTKRRRLVRAAVNAEDVPPCEYAAAIRNRKS